MDKNMNNLNKFVNKLHNSLYARKVSRVMGRIAKNGYAMQEREESFHRYRPVTSHGCMGCRANSESAYSWIVLSRAEVQEWADLHEEDLHESALSIANELGFPTHEYYRGPGQGFAQAASVQLGRNRVLVRRFSGLDI